MMEISNYQRWFYYSQDSPELHFVVPLGSFPRNKVVMYRGRNRRSANHLNNRKVEGDSTLKLKRCFSTQFDTVHVGRNVRRVPSAGRKILNPLKFIFLY